MARTPKKKTPPIAPPSAADLGLDTFTQPPDEGLSLDKLSQAFAALLQAGDDPYSVPDESIGPPAALPAEAASELADNDVPEPLPATSDGNCEISPRSILEAMLFVGLPGGQPLTASQVAGLMRGVRPAEIDEIVLELNEQYRAAHCPYQIEGVEAGYKLTLRDEFAAVREQFYGKIKQAKLSPAAIEVLAVVAYNESLSAEEISKLRGTASGSVLSQLVRRELLRIERPADNPRKPRYFTTPRFLQLFGLETLADLPSSSSD